MNDVKIFDSKKVYDILQLIKNNPLRYLSSKTISSLQDYINGYLSGNPYSIDEPPFWDFDNYLLSKTDARLENGYRNLISKLLLKECDGDEKKAFTRFFEYLEEYKSQNN
jgi:hypothetical protein